MPSFKKKDHIDVVRDTPMGSARVYLVPVSWERAGEGGDHYTVDLQLGVPSTLICWATARVSRSLNASEINLPPGCILESSMAARVLAAIELRMDEETISRG